MKIALVTRGSNGDILPYLHLASKLEKQGHEVILNLPKVFEQNVIPYNLNYTLQDFEDLNDMVNRADKDTSFGVKTFLDWVKNSINTQFEQLIPIVDKCDMLISTNTEFAASSIAEYCQKPFIRTAFAPFLPSKTIPPPIMPYTTENTWLVPILWKILNIPTDIMMAKVLNKNRKALGMEPMKSLTTHSVKNAFNALLYSPTLGSVDPNWKWQWDICGYCFNDSFKYDEKTYHDLLDFIKQDKKPTLFFTFGSCTSKHGTQFVDYLSEIVQKNGYKMIIGSGWSNTGHHLEEHDNLYLLKQAIPHSLIFPECDAVIHHGGSGTTHNVARFGKPQMIVPVFLDQHYWGNRIHKLGIGPKMINSGKISKAALENEVRELLSNVSYKVNALKIAKGMAEENAIDKFSDLLYTIKGKAKKAV